MQLVKKIVTPRRAAIGYELTEDAASVAWYGAVLLVILATIASAVGVLAGPWLHDAPTVIGTQLAQWCVAQPGCDATDYPAIIGALAVALFLTAGVIYTVITLAQYMVAQLDDTDILDKLIAAELEDGERTARDLAKKLHVSRDDIATALDALIEDGIVTLTDRSGVTVYRLTQRAQSAD